MECESILTHLRYLIEGYAVTLMAAAVIAIAARAHSK